MGVLASARDKLGELWYRVKAWAKSVPPDVWIGLVIAFVTLIVIYLAYRKAGSSSSSGQSTTDPIVGQSGVVGTTPLTSQPLSSADVISPGTFDISQLWTDPNKDKGGPKKTYGIDEPPIIGVARADIIKSATTRDESSIVSQIQKFFLAPPAVVNTGYVVGFTNSRDESVTAKMSSNTSSSYPTVSTPAVVPSATAPGKDETAIAKLIQKVTPKPQPKPAAIIRPSPFAITPVPTGRGVNISLSGVNSSLN